MSTSKWHSNEVGMTVGGIGGMHEWKPLMLPLFLSFSLGACSGIVSGPQEDRASLPRVESTIGFSDAPVEGEMIITPSSDAAGWSFSIDFDEDGVPERTGSLTGAIAIPYRFVDVGPHAIHVRFRIGNREETVEEIVVVNDPDAVMVEAVSEVLVTTLLEGIAVDGTGGRVYVGLSLDREIAELDAATLELLRIADPAAPHNGTFEGLAVAPDAPVLYVIDKFGGLQGLELPSLDHVFNLERGGGRFFVVPGPGGLVYTGGNTGVTLIDTGSGEALRSFPLITGIGHFAVDHGNSRIALLENTPSSNAVHLLSAHDFAVEWKLDLPVPGPVPAALAFSPDGDRLYVLLDRDPFRLLVIDAVSGSILRNMVLSGEGCPECPFLFGVANPAATTADGKYVAFPTAIGTFFVDTAEDLPVFRSPDPAAWLAVFCCNIATSPTESDVVFVSDIGNRVFRLRVRR